MFICWPFLSALVIWYMFGLKVEWENGKNIEITCNMMCMTPCVHKCKKYFRTCWKWFIICHLAGGRMIHVWKPGTAIFFLWNKGWIKEITHIISDLTRECLDKLPVILVGLDPEKHNAGGKINFATASPGSFCACFFIQCFSNPVKFLISPLTNLLKV